MRRPAARRLTTRTRRSRDSAAAWLKHVPDATFEELLGRDGSEQLHDPGNHSGPSRLVACPQPCPVVAMEVLVEEKVIPPMRVGLELLRASVDGAPAPLVAQEDPRQSLRDLPSHLEEIHHAP